MIPDKILAMFEFIEYLNDNKVEYMEKYIPLCNDIKSLIMQKSILKPNKNYIDRQKYEGIQNEINEKFPIITSKIYTPISNKLKELGIWSGDEIYSSIWNNNYSTISDFKEKFNLDDVSLVILYKEKYLNFRLETNSDFCCLQLILHSLDEIFKELFDYFKDTDKNEFEEFEAKVVEVNSLEEALKVQIDGKQEGLKFNIPIASVYKNKNKEQVKQSFMNVNNEIIMGSKVIVGNISNNTGQIIIGDNIRISNSLNEKREIFEKIEELIKLIRKEPDISDEARQDLVTNFGKVKEEVIEDNPDKNRIFKWLSNTKKILEALVLTHDVNETVHWIYENLNFISQIGS